MSVHDLFHYHTPPPDDHEIIWILRLTGDAGSLEEYFEHVFAFGADVLEGSHSERDGTLVLRILTFRNDPGQIYTIFTAELATWEEITVISSGEE